MADGQVAKRGRHQGCLMSVEGLSSAVSGLLLIGDASTSSVQRCQRQHRGYSRQRVDLTANSGSAIGIWSGSSSSLGVTIDGIGRSRDAFLDAITRSSANAAELQSSMHCTDLEEVLNHLTQVSLQHSTTYGQRSTTLRTSRSTAATSRTR